MSRTGFRGAAVGLGLLTFLLRILIEFWWKPATWHIADDVGLGFLTTFGLYGAGFFLAAAAPLGIYALLCRKVRLPRSFGVRDGRFVAPPNPIYFGAWSITMLFIAGGMIPAERVPNAYAMRLFTEEPVMFGVALAVVAVPVAVGLALPFLPRPRVELTREGVLIQRLLSRSMIAWSLLPPGGPLPPTGKLRPFWGRPGQIWLYVAGPERYTRYQIPLSVDVDATFLAAAIRHYVEHPDQREGIGTPVELDRLRAGAVENVAPFRDH